MSVNTEDAKPSDVTSSSTTSTAKLNASLLRLKLLDALRNNDQARLRELRILATNSVNASDPQVENVLKLLLHYAVQVGPPSAVQFIVSNKYVDDINSQDSEGNTPLHLAVNSSRYDIVNYLMGLPTINDCVVNAQGRQAIELTDDLAIIESMSDWRTEFVEAKSNELRRAFEIRDYNSLASLLSNQRVIELLDINGTDPVTGDGVLHEFVRKDDVTMCKFILEHGGDPFKRNVFGKLPIDLASSSAMKKLLKESSKEQSIIDPMGNGSSSMADQPPTYKGFLKKWTNFAGGYKLRWFVLDADGRLSYYKSPNDINKSCRGAINLSNARLRMDSSEKSKFEIEIPAGSGTPIRWHLKSNHYIEANRWVWFLQNAIRYNKDLHRAQLAKNQAGSNATNRQAHRNRDSFDSNRSTTTFNINQSGPSHQRGLSSSSMISVSSYSDVESDTDFVKKNSKVKRLKNKLTPGGGSSGTAATASAANSSASTGTDTTPASSATLEVPQVGSASKKPLEEIGEHQSLNVSKHKAGGAQSGASSMVSSSKDSIRSNSVPPRYVSSSGMSGAGFADESDFEDDEENQTVDQETGDVIEKVSNAHASKVIVLLNNLKIEVSSLNDFLDHSHATTAEEVQGICKTTLGQVGKLLDELKISLDARDQKYQKKINRQKEVSTLWENSIKTLEFEIQERERKILELEDKQAHVKKALKQKFGSNAATPIQEKDEANVMSQAGPEDEEIAKFIEEKDDDDDDEFFDAEDASEESVATYPKPAAAVSAAVGAAAAAIGVSSQQDKGATEKEPPHLAEGKQDTEKGAHAEETGGNPLQKEKAQLIQQQEKSFNGYEDGLRTRLAMKDDDRPKLSLWSILKSMVGKDMTKISLPVSFNEPTSLLQRVAEDMEYADLLDKAAQYDDSTLRMVYVAAFAASEYASTVNRIAKPFNPLLGETYEYCRPDKHYRFMVEQVSHHPPIGAAMAESKCWDYYGESAVKSKFYGRSFDIKPLGTWFLNLRPNEGSVNQKSGTRTKEELYTWRKVTSSVIGIIIGNPTVDNYGDMDIVNHNTGDKLLLQFKARGWRDSAACEVKGTVLDAQGKPHWQVFGSWNSKIYARKVNSKDKKPGEKFLIWQVNERPKIPFNLTEFATSLNAPQKSLLPWLPRTDTRFRPDQRAMEEGRYDDAAVDKTRVEEKQRSAKREREASGQTYEPKWFIKKIHPTTGEEYWQFNNKYWQKRAAKDFNDVPDIF